MILGVPLTFSGAEPGEARVSPALPATGSGNGVSRHLLELFTITFPETVWVLNDSSDKTFLA